MKLRGSWSYFHSWPIATMFTTCSTKCLSCEWHVWASYSLNIHCKYLLSFYNYFWRVMGGDWAVACRLALKKWHISRNRTLWTRFSVITSCRKAHEWSWRLLTTCTMSQACGWGVKLEKWKIQLKDWSPVVVVSHLGDLVFLKDGIMFPVSRPHFHNWKLECRSCHSNTHPKFTLEIM